MSIRKIFVKIDFRTLWQVCSQFINDLGFKRYFTIFTSSLVDIKIKGVSCFAAMETHALKLKRTGFFRIKCFMLCFLKCLIIFSLIENIYWKNMTTFWSLHLRDPTLALFYTACLCCQLGSCSCHLYVNTFSVSENESSLLHFSKESSANHHLLTNINVVLVMFCNH